MKVKFELKHMDAQQANAYFAAIKADDQSPIIDLSDNTVSTRGAIAATYPRKDISDVDYLIIDHGDMKQVQKWWGELRRVDCNGVTYTIVKDEAKLTAVEYVGWGISSADHQMYRLVWDPDAQKVNPDTAPERAMTWMDPFPDIDFNVPVGLTMDE